MNGVSPWAAAASYFFANEHVPPVYTKAVGPYALGVYLTPDSLWIAVNWAKGGRVAFRAAFSPEGTLKPVKQSETDTGVVIKLTSFIGLMEVRIAFELDSNSVLRYTTTLKPGIALTIPFWPRDIIFPGKDGMPDNIAGKVHVQQAGTRSGQLYVSMTRPKAGSMLYLQNLTALADYCEQTETSCKEVVGGKWPELGFALPTTKDKPLQADKKVIITDAFIAFDTNVPGSDTAMIHQYLDLLAAVYLKLPKPETKYQDWPGILDKGLQDLINNHGCWSQVKGRSYFNAYVCDYETPPEIMVQLAVLLPLVDYMEWSGRTLEVVQQIKATLPSFYNEKMKTIMRWLPAAEDHLKGEEEQKKPLVMDSWYLHHPLLNLSRLALKGDKAAEKLFLGSLDFAIKVARHFKYRWPVFYKMDTLEVVKEETQPGKGGEKDVAGLYAHVMLQAWELTGKKNYLQEAERAAKTLKGLGFDLFYQANNTAFAAGALLRLYKATKNKLYLDLSYTCLANIFRNVRLWDCNYGYGKNFPSFFALFPLNDAPYTAVYEEQEVFCALHDYLKHAKDVDILPSVTLLVAEYIRCLVNRAVFYYPPMLPKEMLSEKVKMGEVNPDLWIALEDMHDGWEKNGEVGQEVYGAGNAFGILPRHYQRVPGEEFMIFTEYPVEPISNKKGKEVAFLVRGDERMTCKLMIIKTGSSKLPAFKVRVGEQLEVLEGRVNDKHTQYTVRGNQKVKISF